jgi:hypothetical protein
VRSLGLVLALLSEPDAGSGRARPPRAWARNRRPGGRRVGPRVAQTAALTSQANWVAAFALARAHGPHPEREDAIDAAAIAEGRVDILATAISKLDALGEVDPPTRARARSLLLDAWALLATDEGGPPA